MIDELAGQRCSIYARFSCDRQREASIEDQVRRCRIFIEQRGGIVDPALIFTDFAISGASMDRPGFEALLKQVQAKQRGLDVVVVEDLSRLTRDFADAATLFKQLRYAQVRMMGVGDGIDTDGRSAKLMFGVKALISDSPLNSTAAVPGNRAALFPRTIAFPGQSAVSCSSRCCRVEATESARARNSTQASSQAFPNPTIAGTLSVPGRMPPSCPPPTDSGAIGNAPGPPTTKSAPTPLGPNIL